MESVAGVTVDDHLVRLFIPFRLKDSDRLNLERIGLPLSGDAIPRAFRSRSRSAKLAPESGPCWKQMSQVDLDNSLSPDFYDSIARILRGEGTGPVASPMAAAPSRTWPGRCAAGLRQLLKRGWRRLWPKVQAPFTGMPPWVLKGERCPNRVFSFPLTNGARARLGLPKGAIARFRFDDFTLYVFGSGLAIVVVGINFLPDAGAAGVSAGLILEGLYALCRTGTQAQPLAGEESVACVLVASGQDPVLLPAGQAVVAVGVRYVQEAGPEPEPDPKHKGKKKKVKIKVKPDTGCVVAEDIHEGEALRVLDDGRVAPVRGSGAKTDGYFFPYALKRGTAGPQVAPAGSKLLATQVLCVRPAQESEQPFGTLEQALGFGASGTVALPHLNAGCLVPLVASLLRLGSDDQAAAPDCLFEAGTFGAGKRLFSFSAMRLPAQGVSMLPLPDQAQARHAVDRMEDYLAYRLASKFTEDYELLDPQVEKATLRTFANIRHCMTTQGASIVAESNGAEQIENFIMDMAKKSYLPLALVNIHEYFYLLGLAQESAIFPEFGIPAKQRKSLIKLRNDLAQFRLFYRFSHVSQMNHHNEVHRAWRSALALDALLNEAARDVAEADKLLERGFQNQREARWRWTGALVGGVAAYSVSHEVFESILHHQLPTQQLAVTMVKGLSHSGPAPLPMEEVTRFLATYLQTQQRWENLSYLGAGLVGMAVAMLALLKGPKASE